MGRDARQPGDAEPPDAGTRSPTEQPFTLSQELELGLELADLADQIVRHHFNREGYAFENKYDGTPVTEIDRAVERAIRERVAIRRPEYLVLGEEDGLGTGGEGSPRPRWIVDPIDGTRKFVRGIPIFATLLGLEIDGEIVVGVASAPLMAGNDQASSGRRWWAAKGLGAFSDGRLLQVSRVGRLADAHVLHGSVEGWVRKGNGPALLDLAAASWGTFAPGDFWIHLLVAEGAADAAVEPEAAAWDVAPLKVIVEEAGGRFTDFGGRHTVHGGNGVSTNGLIHEEILRYLTS